MQRDGGHARAVSTALRKVEATRGIGGAGNMASMALPTGLLAEGCHITQVRRSYRDRPAWGTEESPMATGLWEAGAPSDWRRE